MALVGVGSVQDMEGEGMDEERRIWQPPQVSTWGYQALDEGRVGSEGPYALVPLPTPERAAMCGVSQAQSEPLDQSHDRMTPSLTTADWLSWQYSWPVLLNQVWFHVTVSPTASTFEIM